MRLDKYLSESGVFSRSEAGKAIRSGRIAVDGAVLRDPSKHIVETASVTCDGKPVIWSKYQYIMLHKPAGYVSATEDKGRTVMDLVPPACSRLGMFPCGRLDIDTVGFLLVTNDGVLGHELLSPKHHVDKTYRFRCDPPIGEDQRKKLCEGVDIGDIVTAPADVVLTGDLPACEGEITIHEGKFHQIKRMFHAVGSEITYLERIRFGGLSLDESLCRGEWRYLTSGEEATLRRSAGRNE